MGLQISKFFRRKKESAKNREWIAMMILSVKKISAASSPQKNYKFLIR